MQSIQNIEEKIFSECRDIVTQLSRLESPGDLLQQFENIVILHEKAMLLKNLDLIQEFAKDENASFLLEKDGQIAELEEQREKLKEEYWQILEEKNTEIGHLTAQLKNQSNISTKEVEIEKPKDLVENILLGDYESQMPETNSPVEEIAEIISENPEVFQEEYDREHPEEEQEEEEDKRVDFVPAEYIPENKVVDETIILTDESEAITDEHLRQIVDIEKKEPVSRGDETIFEDFQKETISEKKFRLGKIKGLNMVKSLFDDDLEELEEPVKEEKHLQKSNMATDFMEAGKPKQNFRIDLNDKVAFTKLLFKGDEDELRRTVNQLNEYKSLDEAKEYLSELYYTKEWDKVDDYAQRLWVLVENKFI